MTENTATFKLPAADELCTALRAAVTKLGGDARQFFEKLGAESEGFVDEFAPDDWPMRQLLVRCLENITFRGRLLAQISADDDRDFLSNFLDAWDVWKEIEPFDHNWIVLVFAGPHLETLFGPIPDRANEIFRCISSLQLDSYYEEFRIKASVQLAFANKELGSDGVLILSGGLISFIRSLNIVLNSLVLSESEASLFKIAQDTKGISGVTDALINLKSTVDTLLEQFQGMVVDSRRPSPPAA